MYIPGQILKRVRLTKRECGKNPLQVYLISFINLIYCAFQIISSDSELNVRKNQNFYFKLCLQLKYTVQRIKYTITLVCQIILIVWCTMNYF